MIKRITISLLMLCISWQLGLAQTLPHAVRLNTDAEIFNTIIWRNQGMNAVSENVQVNYSAMDSLMPGGTGNIRLFGNPFVNGYRINTSSPAFNTGTMATPPLRPSDLLGFDLDNNPRVSCSGIDMGAYEFQVTRTTILIEPEDLHLCVGTSGTLSVTADGASLTYQWQRNGINIPGAISSTLRLNGTLSDAGSYRVLITGPACDTVSKDVHVYIYQLPTLDMSDTTIIVPQGSNFDLSTLIRTPGDTITWFATQEIAKRENTLIENINETKTFFAVRTCGFCPGRDMRAVMLIVEGMECKLETRSVDMLCFGDSIQLTMQRATVDYQWHVVGDTNLKPGRYSYFTPTGPVTLIARSRDSVCEDTLFISVHTVPFQVMDNLTVCGEYGGTPIQLLSLPAAEAWYRLHEGEKEYIGRGLPTVTIENNTQNVFVAKFSDGICDVEKHVSINAFPPKLRMSAPDTLICQGQQVLLATNVDPGIVEWRVKGSPISIDPLVRPDVTTTYQAWVFSEICGDVFTEFTVNVQPRPSFNIMNPSISADTIVYLMASPMANFWTTSDGTRLFNPIEVTDNPTTYIGYYDYGVCRVSASITIALKEEEIPDTHLVNVESRIFCHNDGWAYVVITGASGDYTIEWHNEEETNTIIATTDTITGLRSGGTYTVTVTDRFERPVRKSFTVENVLPITVTREIIQPTNDSCSNGMVIVSVSGGADPSNYVFQFCGGAVVKGQTTHTMQNVGAYVHWMIVHDGMQGCVADTAYFGVFCLGAVSSIDCLKFNCTGCSDVTIIIGEAHNSEHPHPDPHPFTAVVLSNGSIVDSITNITGNDFQIPDLDPGTYTIRVYDRFRSYVQRSVTIERPSPIGVAIDLVHARNSHCDDGRIVLTASGGVGGYMFEFYDIGVAAPGPTYTLQSANAGVNRLRVSDAWGCFIDTNIVLPCMHSRTMPNIFISPNNDGSNEVVKIRDIDFFPRNRVIFFNTYGEIVNEIIDYNNRDRIWAGRNRRGQLLPDGVYYYIVEVEGLPPMGGWVYMVISRHN